LYFWRLAAWFWSGSRLDSCRLAHCAAKVTYNSVETGCEGLSAETWFEPGWETPLGPQKSLRS
jgi:hypothetical protein